MILRQRASSETFFRRKKKHSLFVNMRSSYKDKKIVKLFQKLIRFRSCCKNPSLSSYPKYVDSHQTLITQQTLVIRKVDTVLGCIQSSEHKCVGGSLPHTVNFSKIFSTIMIFSSKICRLLCSLASLT